MGQSVMLIFLLTKLFFKEAKTKFNLYLARANLKEKTGKFSEAISFLEQALQYE